MKSSSKTRQPIHKTVKQYSKYHKLPQNNLQEATGLVVQRHNDLTQTDTAHTLKHTGGRRSFKQVQHIKVGPRTHETHEGNHNDKNMEEI